MKLNDVKFYKSVWLWSKEVFIDEKSEVVFVGRSNVGKSSIMNALFEKKDLVKTSSKPGKTKLANLFLVENKFQLAKYIKNNIYGKKIVIGMGAGTISTWLRELPKLL